MKAISCKLLVIGAGPGGYVCATRAGQRGIDTVIVEAKKPGGTCLNIGCIPSKALIHAADEYQKVARFAAGDSPLGIGARDPRIDLAKTMVWKDEIVERLNGGVAGLLKHAAVKVVEGWARFRDGKTVEVETETGRQVIHAEEVVIATGSRPVGLATLPFGGRVISSTEALALRQIPRQMVVIGAGYIGLELGTAFAKMGAHVSIVEALPRILPQYDAALTRPVEMRLRQLGVDTLTSAKATGLTPAGNGLMVETSDGQSKALIADNILVAVGRAPLTTGWGLEAVDLDMDGPFLRIDERCRTSMRGIYAIGDVTGEPMLAHRATTQGEMVARIIAGEKRSWDSLCIPAICFTDPEIAVAGLLPDAARAAGIDIQIGMSPFQANGRALTLGQDAGFIRVVARADNHLILGIQGVGAGIAELSAAFSMTIEMGARLEDIAAIIHAHPTQSETLMEAARSALNHSLDHSRQNHLPQVHMQSTQ